MPISWYRDLSIIIFNSIAILVLIFTAVILYLTWRRMAVILENVARTTEIMENLSQKVITPLMRVFDIINIARCFIWRGKHGNK